MLWSGCLAAAKEISLGTMNGQNTTETRRALNSAVLNVITGGQLRSHLLTILEYTSKLDATISSLT
jgi:hypothetical protein